MKTDPDVLTQNQGYVDNRVLKLCGRQNAEILKTRGLQTLRLYFIFRYGITIRLSTISWRKLESISKEARLERRKSLCCTGVRKKKMLKNPATYTSSSNQAMI